MAKKNTTITDEDLGFNNIRRKIREDAAKGPQVYAVGFDDPKVAEYAAFNEYGTATIPSRPFMRSTYDANRKRYEAITDKRAFKISAPSGGDPADPRIAAEAYQRDVVAAIEGWTSPANAASTIKSKGRNDPLKNTGKMKRSVIVKEVS